MIIWANKQRKTHIDHEPFITFSNVRHFLVLQLKFDGMIFKLMQNCCVDMFIVNNKKTHPSSTEKERDLQRDIFPSLKCYPFKGCGNILQYTQIIMNFMELFMNVVHGLEWTRVSSGHLDPTTRAVWGVHDQYAGWTFACFVIVLSGLCNVPHCVPLFPP